MQLIHILLIAMLAAAPAERRCGWLHNPTPANWWLVDRDEFFPVSIPVEMYESIPGSELWIVPHGDHVPIYEGRTPEFLRVTQAFLSNAQAR